ncbi:MAG: hypothetical protein LUG96_16520, partial [Tannerellaceae bacterium]|nr:hypothetical protein [Tannerellaceae bacterium]
TAGETRGGKQPHAMNPEAGSTLSGLLWRGVSPTPRVPPGVIHMLSLLDFSKEINITTFAGIENLI